MTSNRNAIADYLSYTLISTGENINLHFIDNEIWATLNQISKIYGEDENTIQTIIKNIFENDGFDPVVFSKQIDDVTFYAFDIIIQVGFKVKNQNALRFRQWATKLLSEYLIKGFALDDARLKNCGQVFDDDYFKRVQEEYAEIALSKRSFIQKITDLFATAYDYDKLSFIANQFFETMARKKSLIGLSTENEIIDFYLQLGKQKASAKIPLTMEDWIYYFKPILDSENDADLKSKIEIGNYFNQPAYFEKLSFNTDDNSNFPHYNNEIFEIIKIKRSK